MPTTEFDCVHRARVTTERGGVRGALPISFTVREIEEARATFVAREWTRSPRRQGSQGSGRRSRRPRRTRGTSGSRDDPGEPEPPLPLGRLADTTTRRPS